MVWNASPLKCDAVLVSEWYQTFQRVVVLFIHLKDYVTAEEDSTKIL